MRQFRSLFLVAILLLCFGVVSNLSAEADIEPDFEQVAEMVVEDYTAPSPLLDTNVTPEATQGNVAVHQSTLGLNALTMVAFKIMEEEKRRLVPVPKQTGSYQYLQSTRASNIVTTSATTPANLGHVGAGYGGNPRQYEIYPQGE